MPALQNSQQFHRQPRSCLKSRYDRHLRKATVKKSKLPANAPGINNFKYKAQFGVVVICRDEEHHRQVWLDLTGRGYTCKAVRV